MIKLFLLAYFSQRNERKFPKKALTGVVEKLMNI